MRKFFATFTILIFLLTGCSSLSSMESISKTDFYFDTVVTITLYGKADPNVINSCFSLCETYEQLFSKTIESSEISILNRTKTLANPNPETLDIIQTALYYNYISSGKFDITLAGVSHLWNFSADNPVLPDPADIQKALTGVGITNLSVSEDSITINNPLTSIDLGGIAKGFIADRIKEFLLSEGIENAIIDLGGNVLLVGAKPDGNDYLIGIQKPFSKRNNTICAIKGSDISIVSSGNYERYFVENNKIFHHILDSSTGYPVENNLSSVTIISSSSTDGDALSTSCFALGLVDGMTLVESLDGIEAIFIDASNDLHLSSGLKMTDGNVITISH